jgi:hypothetical protein
LKIPHVVGPEPTIEAQLEHLDSLLKDGLITEQEHENARRQVLANI